MPMPVSVTANVIQSRQLPIYREVRDKFVNVAAPPASTTLEISKLAREGALLEVEAIAVLPAR
jgi:enamine deaminase RidA (YjgF/YER057c/UK114 family)